MDRMTPAIQIDNLTFHYPDQTTLFERFSLRVESEQRFGLFGPNGAGKTTLMNLMTGLYAPQKGSIRVKDGFGFVPQDLSFYEELSPVENMAFFGAWSGLKRKAIRDRTS